MPRLALRGRRRTRGLSHSSSISENCEPRGAWRDDLGGLVWHSRNHKFAAVASAPM